MLNSRTEQSFVSALEETANAVKEGFKARDERLLDLEQKVARGISGMGGGNVGAGDGESLGAQAVRAFGDRLAQLKSNRGAASVEVKTLTTATGSGAGLFPQAFDTDPVVKPRRPLRVRDLLDQVNVTTPVINWVSQETRTNNSDIVTEGATKPTSAIAYTAHQETTSVIACLIKASNQILDDATQLQSIINSELEFMLAYTEEQQLLLGDGVGDNLSGLITNSTNYSGAFSVTSEKNVDRLGLAALQVTNAEVGPVNGFILHPTDAMKIRLTKDSLGRPLYPQAGPLILFGVPVVESRSISAGYFLAGAFRQAARIYDQWQTRIEIATQHDDDWARNLVTVRAEKRLTVATRQPLALVYGALPQ